jgi:general secretion pathway protein H
MNRVSTLPALVRGPRARAAAAALPARARGFTLIEIMVVVVIIGLLAAFIVPQVMGRVDEARITKVKGDIQMLETALSMYRLEGPLGQRIPLRLPGPARPRVRPLLGRPRRPGRHRGVRQGQRRQLEPRRIGRRSAPSMSAARPARGFTLVEMLVVVVIIGVMVVGAVLALGVAGRDRSLENETRRFDALLGYAREQAELQTREYGLRFTTHGYVFIAHDPRSGQWLQVNDDVLRPRTLPPGLEFEVELEGRRIVLDDASKPTAALTPHIGVASSGDFTSFKVTFKRAGGLPRQSVGVRDDGSLEVGELVETGAG